MPRGGTCLSSARIMYRASGRRPWPRSPQRNWGGYDLCQDPPRPAGVTRESAVWRPGLGASPGLLRCWFGRPDEWRLPDPTGIGLDSGHRRAYPRPRRECLSSRVAAPPRADVVVTIAVRQVVPRLPPRQDARRHRPASLTTFRLVATDDRRFVAKRSNRSGTRTKGRHCDRRGSQSTNRLATETTRPRRRARSGLTESGVRFTSAIRATLSTYVNVP